MLAFQAAGASDVYGGPQRLRNQAACLPMIGCIPVFGLVFDFAQRGLPARPELVREPGQERRPRFDVFHVRGFLLLQTRCNGILAVRGYEDIDLVSSTRPILSGAKDGQALIAVRPNAGQHSQLGRQTYGAGRVSNVV